MHKLDRLILETFASTSIREENKKPDDLPKAFIAAIEKRYGPVHERDFFNDDLSRYMKFSSEDKESGSIGHTVINLPSFFKMYDDFEELVQDIKDLMRSPDIRQDKAARELFDAFRSNFRKLQRYLREERPEQYELIRMRSSLAEIHEMFVSHASLLKEQREDELKIGRVKNIEIYVNDQSSFSDTMFYSLVDTKSGKEFEISVDVAGEQVDLNYVKEENPILAKIGFPDGDAIGNFIVKDINKELDEVKVINESMLDDIQEEEELPHAIVGSDDTFTFGYDLDAIQNVLNHLKSSGYVEGRDYEQHIGYGDDMPNAITLKNPKMEEDTVLGNLLDAASDAGETDYEEYRKQFEDYKEGINESMLDEEEEDEEIPEPEEEPNTDAPEETILEDATDTILAKFPTLKAAIVKLQTEDFKEFVDSIDWISPRPTSFRINLINGQEYIIKWMGKGFEAQILGKRYYLNKIDDYQQALDKLAILYREGPMSGAGEGEAADTDTGGGGGGGGDFPGDDAAGGGGEEGGEDLGGDLEADDTGGEDLTDEPIDFEAGEEPEA